MKPDNDIPRWFAVSLGLLLALVFILAVEVLEHVVRTTVAP